MDRDDFIYAAGYYPLMHDREDWDRDLKLMKESGINMVRTAELFNTWDRIEPEKGKFNFEFLDEFFDLCLKYNIKILLGTGTASPPYWLHELYPDVNILNNHGEQYPNNVSYTWACIDNPYYINEVERYLTVLIDRYKDHEALYAYQIHNEIGFPFMSLKDGDIDVYCYCEYTKKNYRKWIENKYETLEKLNHAYRWGATNTCHTSWEQVEPPKTKPTSWSSVTRWLDWRLFWMDNFVNFVSWQNEIIKKYDNRHLTTTNIFFLKSQDPLGVITALDQFEMAKAVDIIGYDLYPGSGNKLEKKPEFSSMFLDMAKSTSKPLGKNYWLLETESGPINGWVLGPSRNVKGFDLIRNVFEAVGHDAKLTLYQGWREWDFQPLHWGAIVDLDGRKTERTVAAKKIGDILNEYGKSLVKCNNNKGEIAILISKENSIVVNGMGQQDFLIKALRGAYTTFWEKGYNVEFINEELVMNGYANKYPVIYMPFVSVIDNKLAKALDMYVREGGTLIGTARCGMLGQHGWYNHRIPCYNLSDVFGVEAIEVNAGFNPKITYNMKNYTGYWHKEILQVNSDDLDILARFNDDTPAVTINSYGKGHGIYFATHPEVAYLEEKSYILWDIIDDILKPKGLNPKISVDYTNRDVKEIDVHYLGNDNEEYLIITNYVNQKHSNFFINNEKCVRISMKTDREYLKAIDIMTEESMDIHKCSDSILIETKIIKNQTKIIKLL